jgi:hypothetical protein
VAGAFRDCHYEPASRLSAVELEHVLADEVGLGRLSGNARILHDVYFPLRQGIADDHDLRIAHASAGGAR